MQLDKSVTKSSWKRFPASITSGWILRGKQPEIGVSFDQSLGFRNEKLSIIIKDTIQGL